MNRKHFLSSLVPMAATLQAVGRGRTDLQTADTFHLPAYLEAGDTIGICCPAGFISLDDIQPAVKKIQEWGYQVYIGETVGKKDFTFGGSDEQRAADLQQMLDNPAIKAILFARGGYGGVRIIDRLDFKKFRKNPKWIIGFSDATIFHAHINQNFGIATIHAKMCNSFPSDWNKADRIQQETIESINGCLNGTQMIYPFLSNDKNRTGMATGELIGGNLKTLESIAGSRSDIETKNKILFVEDTGEYLYSIDRMFWNLKRSGKLDRLKGLIIGGFKIKVDENGEPFGSSLEDIVLEKVAGFDYPVCFDFPVGHQKNNFALKCGVMHTLQVQVNDCRLTELR